MMSVKFISLDTTIADNRQNTYDFAIVGNTPKILAPSPPQKVALKTTMVTKKLKNCIVTLRTTESHHPTA
jgi:hypothetical protein